MITEKKKKNTQITEINTDIPKQEMRELLYLCVKNTHFTLNNKRSPLSPLGPVLANIFMVELKRNIIPTLSNDISLWKRYVDGTFYFIKLTSINKVFETVILQTSNSPLKLKQKTKISFLDVLLICNNSLRSTTVYPKNAHMDIYIIWKSLPPYNWKWGTLKTLPTTTFDICSTYEY